MLVRTLIRSAQSRATGVAAAGKLRSIPAPSRLPAYACPFSSTSRLTLDDDLGVDAAAPKPKPKGKAKTPPKHRPPKELPQLDEDDLEEQFVRGSGPGGQATNKTSNAVSLIHKPTGTRVFCHETRSRETNRKLARRTMRGKLDELFSPPGESARDLKAKRERQKAAAKKRKARRKAEAKNGATASNDSAAEAEPDGGGQIGTTEGTV